MSVTSAEVVSGRPSAGRTHGRGGNHNLSPPKPAVSLFAGVLAILLLAMAPRMNAGPAGAKYRTRSAALGTAATGTVARVRGTGTLLVRLSATRLVALNNPRVVASDGSTLADAEIRPGDTVSIQDHQVVDRSQSRQARQGLVATGPDAPGADIVLQLASGRQIVVDLDRRTEIAGAGGTHASPLLIMDGDEVWVTGMFDSQMGEMTRTESVTYRRPPR